MGTKENTLKNEPQKENWFKKIWNYFTTYEKIWFLTITVASIIVAIILPEDDLNGVKGWVITLLYLGDTILNILCELLISKQSRWNFILSLAIEILEIVTLIILSSMFASMATTLFFWIPIDIISFIQWTKHKDKDDEELTEVRQMKPWQTALFFALVTVWTLGIGYLLTVVSPETDFIVSEEMLYTVSYLDACESAMGVANGVFIMLRYKEQWWTWLIVAGLETAINIITGQWVLLVLKVGYLMNSIYGLVEWTKYIKTHKKEKLALANGTNDNDEKYKDELKEVMHDLDNSINNEKTLNKEVVKENSAKNIDTIKKQKDKKNKPDKIENKKQNKK